MPVALFDLDNTLLDREAAFARWARSFCESNGLPDDAHAWLVAVDDDGLRPREELFAGVRIRFDLAAPVDELVDAYHRDYPASFTFPDDSRNALRRLRSAGWKVAVVTNGPKSQERKLEVTQLGDEVDAVCVSALVESWKPDIGIFEEAARRCGVDLEGWMVGDSGPADIRGGQRVGLRTIWIHRGRSWDLGGPGPDAQVSDVPAAVRIILGEMGPD
ncbi:MAG TPA: HAD family hydrolase [Acidimicrobiales bacterium]